MADRAEEIADTSNRAGTKGPTGGFCLSASHLPRSSFGEKPPRDFLLSARFKSEVRNIARERQIQQDQRRASEQEQKSTLARQDFRCWKSGWLANPQTRTFPAAQNLGFRSSRMAREAEGERAFWHRKANSLAPRGFVCVGGRRKRGFRAGCARPTPARGDVAGKR